MISSEPPPPPEEASPEPYVPLWTPFAVLGVVLILVSLFGLAVYGVLHSTDPSVKDSSDLPDAATLGLTLLQDAILLLGAWVAVKLTLHRADLGFFGLRPVRDVRNAAKWAAIVFGGFWAVTVVLALIFGQPADQQLVTDIKAQQSLAVLVSYGVLICVVAPFVEEFFFRGFMFTVFRRRLGVGWAALLVGLIFGASHAPAPAISLIALGAFGIGLCLLYWRTQSIIPCMALHALNNSITFGVVKSLDPALFAGVVVLSVATVIAGATALSGRSAVTA
jgi:hypothetical protein